MNYKYFIAFAVNGNHVTDKQTFFGNKCMTINGRMDSTKISIFQEVIAKELGVDKVVITFFQEIPS